MLWLNFFVIKHKIYWVSSNVLFWEFWRYFEGLLTHDTSDYIRITQPHDQKCRYYIFHDMDPIQTNQNYLKEAENQIYNFDVALILFEHNLQFP